MSHTRFCAESSAPANRCKCSCDGDWHGSAAPGAAPPPAGRQPAPVGEQIAPSVETELLDLIADLVRQGIAEPDNAWAIVLTSVSTKLSDNIEAAVSDERLEPADARKLRRSLKKVHWLCELCAAVLTLDSLAQDVKTKLIDRITALIMEGVGGAWRDSRAAHAVVKTLVKAQIEALTSIANEAQMRLVVRLVGLASCPALERHPEIYELCVRPLLKAATNSFILRWLTARSQDFGMSDSQRQTLEEAADEALVS